MCDGRRGKSREFKNSAGKCTAPFYPTTIATDLNEISSPENMFCMIKSVIKGQFDDKFDIDYYMSIENYVHN